MDKLQRIEPHDVVADIKNKLGPFWTLVDIMLVDDGNMPEDAIEYAEMMQDTAIKCRKNQGHILAKLNEILAITSENCIPL
jgi:hypothetical protein